MLYEESRKHFEDGFRYSIASKDTVGAIWNIRDIGGSYQMLGDKITCDSFLHKALRLAEEKRDTMMVRNILCSLADNNIETLRLSQSVPKAIVDQYIQKRRKSHLHQRLKNLLP